MTGKIFRYIFIPALVLALCIQLYIYLEKNYGVKEVLATPTIGGNFRLIDTSGKQVRASDFRDQLMLVYFGFTHCPGICPADMQSMTEVLEQLGDEAKNVAPLFITLDPERDDPMRMKIYLSNFHPAIRGLTGSMESVKEAAGMYKVYFSKMPMEHDPENYMINHSTHSYLMGRNGKYITHFRHGQPVDEIVKEIRKHL